jgi:LDH2 family malate/lactate/ureidoglycolate dehydrogenase
MLAEYDRQETQYQRADQSSFYLAIAIDSFVSVGAFKADMDYLMSQVAEMEPYPGLGSAQLPGGPEWNREREYARDGIPISQDAALGLERSAALVGVAVPW